MLNATRRLISGLLLLPFAAAAASAAITVYECRFDQGTSRGGGWITEVVYITLNDANDEVTVYDPVIDHFVGQPIPARLTASTKVRQTFTWEVQTQNKGQSSRMKYTLSYYSDGRPASMRAQPGGYDNSWSGNGSCKLSRQ